MDAAVGLADMAIKNELPCAPTEKEELRSRVALLTGGGDKPYAYGLATALNGVGLPFDLIGSDELDIPDVHAMASVSFLNLRGNADPNASLARKVMRVLAYYAKLIGYAADSEAKIFHILWNNKFELLDRTLLMLYYRALAKKIVITVHNVNRQKRDSEDTLLNRITLRIQYRLVDHVFAHTERMKQELIEEFGAAAEGISVIPFGINNAVPTTGISKAHARLRLGIQDSEKILLFFGNIAPYKGLEYLTRAFQDLTIRHPDMRLVIAGWPKNCPDYWHAIRESIREHIENGRIILRAEYIPDDDTEIYFKAADALVLPYRYIYQSGVLFLGYSFGLPVIAADVGSLKEEVIEGKTGFVFRPEDTEDLARTIEEYFASDLYANLELRRDEILDIAAASHSWDLVARTTLAVYSKLLGVSASDTLSGGGSSAALYDSGRHNR